MTRDRLRTLVLSAAKWTAGTYQWRLEAGGRSSTRKMVVLGIAEARCVVERSGSTQVDP
jgi:hypothetical protein